MQFNANTTLFPKGKSLFTQIHRKKSLFIIIQLLCITFYCYNNIITVYKLYI